MIIAVSSKNIFNILYIIVLGSECILLLYTVPRTRISHKIDFMSHNESEAPEFVAAIDTGWLELLLAESAESDAFRRYYVGEARGSTHHR